MAHSLDELLAYRPRLRDYATLKPLAEVPSSKLVYLHAPGTSDSDRLLESLSGAPDPENCVLVLENVAFPPLRVPGQAIAPHHTYEFKATFNRLLTAPTLRLDCIWKHVNHPQPVKPTERFKVTLEFHLSTLDQETPNVEDLQQETAVEHYGKVADELSFTSHGATCSGFNLANLPSIDRQLQDHGRQMITVLRGLITPKSPVKIRLRFEKALTDPTSTFVSVLPFVMGEGSQRLPSLSAREWNAFLPPKSDRTVEDLVYGPTPFPMLPPLEPGSTFATATHAAVELYESSLTAFLEEEIMLKEWAKAPHLGVVIQIGGIFVMAMRFQSMLGGKVDIPDRLHAEFKWTDHATGDGLSGTATRCVVAFSLPVAYDALFILHNPSEAIRESAVHRTDVDPRHYQPITVHPIISRSALEKQLSTAGNVLHQDSARWRPMILNQDHEQPTVDLPTARIPDCEDTPLPEEVEKVWLWLLSWRDWNEEQLQAIKSIRNAVAGFSLISAPAGCGKTLLTGALCAFFNMLGLHVMYLAPANSNCEDFIPKFASNFKDNPQVRATRIFPSAADADIRKHLRPSEGAHEESVESLEARLIANIQMSGQKYNAYAEYGLPAQVLNAARTSEFSHFEDMNGTRKDIWAELKTYLETFDEDGNFAGNASKFQEAYNACKSYFVGVSRMIVTTTGNVKSETIVDNFAQDKYGSKCNGIVVVVDEAGKDKEVDTLAALLSPVFRKKITGVILIGDEKQLEPTNKSGKDVNPFAHRLSIPLLTRLKREGFPCTELVEQHRMSHHIADWPSKNFYGGLMRNGPSTYQLLSVSRPGLFNCLRTILAGLGKDIDERWSDTAADSHLRTQYIEILGRRDSVRGSTVVREHIKGFFNEVYWQLRAYYGEKLSKNCYIITAYKASKNQWMDAKHSLQKRFSIPDAQLPSIMTIDSSQGSEAEVTILDCSIQNYAPHRQHNGLGFIDDDRRMNVAFTRAKEVRWVIGGHCGVGFRPLGQPGTPAYVRYKEEKHPVTQLKYQKIENWDGDWLKVLRKKEVRLPVRYSDDMARGS